jgi:hypothetical protein
LQQKAVQSANRMLASFPSEASHLAPHQTGRQFVTRKQGAKTPWSARKPGLDGTIASPEIEAPIPAK